VHATGISRGAIIREVRSAFQFRSTLASRDPPSYMGCSGADTTQMLVSASAFLINSPSDWPRRSWHAGYHALMSRIGGVYLGGETPRTR
jgi:hypothetical protein